MSKDFMEYFYKNHIDENPQKVEMLKKGLDSHSKDLIENIIKRQEHMYTHNLFDTRLLSRVERKDINIYHIKKKYRGIAYPYGVENFYFHCGLRFLKKNVLKKYQKKDVIDAGAASGDTPAIFSREYSFRNIYAFEPENNNYKKLLKNIKKFRLDNVIPINKGVGDKNQTLSITSEEGQSHISSYGKQKVEILTIDQFVKENNITVGLIKMDIEGFEYFAAKGAENTIKEFKPILLISIYHSGKDFFEMKPLLEKWGGYKLMIRKLNPGHFFFDTMLIAVPV